MAIAVPLAGDVIIHKICDSAASTHYGVGLYEGEVQFIGSNREQLQTHATTFAERTRVDVWFTDDRRRYEHAIGFRPASS